MLEIVDAHVSLGTGDVAREVLRGVSCCVAPGEIVSIIGANGCGKSTLASLACAGRLCSDGRVAVEGIDPAESEDARLEVRRLVGLVQQNPLDQIVSSCVADEVAFGPRNLGLEPGEVDARVAEALGLCDLIGYEKRDTTGLSGGEQQRLALAGVLAMRPAYLVLDEATSMLDSSVRGSFRALFWRLTREHGLGILQITHEAAEVLASDRVLVLDGGRIAWEGAPVELLSAACEIEGNPLADNPLCKALRCVISLGYQGRATRGTIDAKDALLWLSTALRDGSASSAHGAAVLHALEAALPSGHERAPMQGAGIVARGLSFSYQPNEPVLRGVDLEARAGEVTLLAGASGCGKSTLLSILAGLESPESGIVSVCGKAPAPGEVGLAFQRPENQLFLNSVYEELALGPRCAGCSDDEIARRVAQAAALVGLDDELMQRYPFALSGGQARRVAIASILSLSAGAYLFDEPTAGLDARGRADMHALARTLARRGLPVVVVSHDLEEWLPVVDAVSLMRGGRIVWSGPAALACANLEVFNAAGIEPPFALRAACELRDLLDGGEPDAH